MTKRAALVVIDGWGHREEEYGNAIMQAATPVMDGLVKDANFAVVEASGALNVLAASRSFNKVQGTAPGLGGDPPVRSDCGQGGRLP